MMDVGMGCPTEWLWWGQQVSGVGLVADITLDF